MKVGDLVVVVKPTLCCGNRKRLGAIFRITEFRDGSSLCHGCGRHSSQVDAMGFGGNHCFSLERLRVIPPLNELEAEKAVETVNA